MAVRWGEDRLFGGRALVAVVMLVAVCYSTPGDSYDGLDEWLDVKNYSRVKTMHRFMPGDVPTDDYGGFHMKADTCFGRNGLKVYREEMVALPEDVTEELREKRFHLAVEKRQMSYVATVRRFLNARLVHTTVRELIINRGNRCPELIKERWNRRRVVLGVIEAVEVEYTMKMESVDHSFDLTEADIKKGLRLIALVAALFGNDLLPAAEEVTESEDGPGGLIGIANGLGKEVDPLGDSGYGKMSLLDVWDRRMYLHRNPLHPSIVETTIAVSDCWTWSLFRRERCKRASK